MCLLDIGATDETLMLKLVYFMYNIDLSGVSLNTIVEHRCSSKGKEWVDIDVFGNDFTFIYRDHLHLNVELRLKPQQCFIMLQHLVAYVRCNIQMENIVSES